MKRTVLLSIRAGIDDKTKEQLLFVKLAALPTVIKTGDNAGKLWYPKKEDLIIDAVINQAKKPVDYQTFINYTPGCLIDVYYGYNELVDKSYIEKLELAPGTTLHNQTDTYI